MTQKRVMDLGFTRCKAAKDQGFSLRYICNIFAVHVVTEKIDKDTYTKATTTTLLRNEN